MPGLAQTSADGGPPIDTLVILFVAITVAWIVIAALVMRRQRRRTPVGALEARPRNQSLRMNQSGMFVPLSPVAPAAREPEPEPEPQPEPEPEPEPDLEPLPPFPHELGTATTYEIVWYRLDEKILFALQPVDGRSVTWARYRSSSFGWSEDRDPPASLRAAQRAHGRLRARLVRDGWQPAGRGEPWFGHRFSPPDAEPSDPAPEDED